MTSAIRPSATPARRARPVLRSAFGRRFRHNEQSLRIAEAAEPDRRGAQRHPHAHRLAGAADTRGQDRPHRRSRGVHQPRHRRRDPLRHPRRRGSAAGGDRAARRHGLARIDALVHDLVETSARAGEIVQSEEVGEAMLALRASCSSTSTSAAGARRARARHATSADRRVARRARRRPGRDPRLRGRHD